jgi:hypothetical protein
MVDHQRAVAARGGCPLGSLVQQRAETDERAQQALAIAFDRWEASSKRA